jgi:NAD+ kinase
MAIKKIGILYHPKIQPALTQAKELEDFLAAKGISVWLCSAWEGEQAKSQLDGTELILTIGGDGTILRAAQVAVPEQIPIIGINLGRLGFMTELSAGEAKEKLPALLEGGGWVDERAMLEAELKPAESEPATVFHALNDVVVARGAVARVVYVEASIDDQALTTYKGDGVMVATATGSTGYSLAAGGPILYPRSKDFLLLPVVPHLSPPYPMVLPATAVVSLRLATTHQATLGIDGHINLPLTSGAVITVKQSPRVGRFLRVHPETSFYASLGQKLKGRVD